MWWLITILIIKKKLYDEGGYNNEKKTMYKNSCVKHAHKNNSFELIRPKKKDPEYSFIAIEMNEWTLGGYMLEP